VHIPAVERRLEVAFLQELVYEAEAVGAGAQEREDVRVVHLGQYRYLPVELLGALHPARSQHLHGDRGAVQAAPVHAAEAALPDLGSGVKTARRGRERVVCEVLYGRAAGRERARGARAAGSAPCGRASARCSVAFLCRYCEEDIVRKFFAFGLV
jgi:hypothetical protein